MTGGKYSAGTDAYECLYIPHGLRGKPDFASVTLAIGDSDAVNKLAIPVVDFFDSSTIVVRVKRSDSHTWFANNPVSVFWIAGMRR